MKNVAVIPARGGSKRIPQKNIRDFCGKPMIAWSIAAAQASGCFDDIIVSTDDPKTSAVAESFGARVPFVRPPELSDDFTPTTPVIKHATEWCLENLTGVTHVCCIYATAPFLTAEYLSRGLEVLTASDSDYAFSVTSYAFPIQRALRLDDKNRTEMFNPEYFSIRSQDLEASWHDAGQFYWGTADAWIEERPIFSTWSKAVILPRHRVQDIDTWEDWEFAERIFKAL